MQHLRLWREFNSELRLSNGIFAKTYSLFLERVQKNEGFNEPLNNAHNSVGRTQYAVQ